MIRAFLRKKRENSKIIEKNFIKCIYENKIIILIEKKEYMNFLNYFKKEVFKINIMGKNKLVYIEEEIKILHKNIIHMNIRKLKKRNKINSILLLKNKGKKTIIKYINNKIRIICGKKIIKKLYINICKKKKILHK